MENTLTHAESYLTSWQDSLTRRTRRRERQGKFPTAADTDVARQPAAYGVSLENVLLTAMALTLQTGFQGIDGIDIGRRVIDMVVPEKEEHAVCLASCYHALSSAAIIGHHLMQRAISPPAQEEPSAPAAAAETARFR